MSKQTELELKDWLIKWIEKEIKIDKTQIKTDELFVNFGLGSRQSVMLATDLEDYLNKELDVSLAWNYPTIDKLVEYLAKN